LEKKKKERKINPLEYILFMNDKSDWSHFRWRALFRKYMDKTEEDEEDPTGNSEAAILFLIAPI
jgi:hypothetical protein